MVSHHQLLLILLPHDRAKTQRAPLPLAVSSSASAVTSEETSTSELKKCKSPVRIQMHAGWWTQQPVYLKDYVKQVNDSM